MSDAIKAELRWSSLDACRVLLNSKLIKESGEDSIQNQHAEKRRKNGDQCSKLAHEVFLSLDRAEGYREGWRSGSKLSTEVSCERMGCRAADSCLLPERFVGLPYSKSENRGRQQGQQARSYAAQDHDQLDWRAAPSHPRRIMTRRPCPSGCTKGMERVP
jgi:hypothetical protein